MKSFIGNKAWLSNMSIFPKPIVINGEAINSSESYYMSRKVIDPSIRRIIVHMNPYEAKKYCSPYSKRITLRDDWNDELRLKVMKEALDIKFSIPYYRIKLLLHSEYISEINGHGDTFFGICNGKGKDHLGRLIREKREEVLKEEIYRETIRIGDVYSSSDMDYKCFTANSTLNSKNGLVMGAGNAKIVKHRYPGIDDRFGQVIEDNSIYGSILDTKENIIAFQTKRHFSRDSEIDLIKNSIEKLNEIARTNPDKKIGLPFPGVNNGNLKQNIVLPYLLSLEKNITVWSFDYFTPITIIVNDTMPIDIKNRLKTYIDILKRRKYIVRVIDSSVSSSVNLSNISEDILDRYFPTHTVKTSEEKYEIFNIFYKTLGLTLDRPSELIIMWTSDAIEGRYPITPETGYINGAIMRLAYDNNIPIINLGIKDNIGDLDDRSKL